MRTDALREVLLVKAIEAADPAGRILTHDDRERAARESMRAAALASDDVGSPAATPRVAQALAARAHRLVPPLIERHPALGDLLLRGGLPRGAGTVLLIVGFVAGIALSAMHGSRRINILAMPFLGLLAWNLLVYAWVAVAAVRGRVLPRSAGPRLVGTTIRAIGRQLGPRVARIAQVDTDLGAAVRGYLVEYSQLGSARLAQRLQQWLHLAAAALGLGLLAGLYQRGIGHAYVAGWESTWLGPAQVRWLIDALFAGPAHWAGIGLPATLEDVARLQFLPDGSGGAPAGPWIHLIALCLLAAVIVPRVALAAVAAVRAARSEREGELPPPLAKYAASVLDAGGQGRPLVVEIVPYAHEPGAARREALEATVRSAFGRNAKAQWRAAIAYGDEENLTAPAAGLAGRGLLVALAATPESENHGHLLALARQRAGAVRTLLLVDESSYRERFGRDAALAGRLEERRRLWQDFAARHAMDVAFAGDGPP